MGANVRARRGEAAVAAGLLVLAVYVAIEAARMPRGTVALPGPGFFPAVLAAGLGAAAVSLLARLGLGPGRDEPVTLGRGHVATTLLALAGVAWLLESLGFFLTMTLFLLVLFRALSPLGWVRSAVAAAVTTGLAYAFFEHLLGVTLPRGGW